MTVSLFHKLDTRTKIYATSEMGLRVWENISYARSNERNITFMIQLPDKYSGSMYRLDIEIDAGSFKSRNDFDFDFDQQLFHTKFYAYIIRIGV